MESRRGDVSAPATPAGFASASVQEVPSIEPAAQEAISGRALPPAAELAEALHEVSNALTVIVGWVERAREAASDATDNPLLERALAIAASRSRHARVIVRRAIGADVASEPALAVAELVADATLGLDPEARDEGVRIASLVADDAAALEIAEASNVLQVLTNLLLNALAVSPVGGVVRLDVHRRASDGAAVFVVEDEGPGIPPARRATLLTAGVSTRVGGAGIGLACAASLARAGGGSLELVDGSGGARFELTWPALAPRPPVSDAKAPRPSLDGARILLVEDDGAIVELLQAVLGARGAAVVAIRTEVELASALATGPFDAALLDASPFAGALAPALERLYGTSPGARVLVISGSACAPVSVRAGLDVTWVRKPFDVAELLAALVAPARFPAE